MIRIAAEDARGGRIYDEMPRLFNLKPDPPCGEHSPELAVREQRDITHHSPESCDQAIRPRADLRGRFSVRAAIAKDLPIRTFLSNILGMAALILAVVPLLSIGFDFRLVGSPGQLACRNGSLSRTCKDAIEARGGHPGPQPTRLIFTMRRKRQIGAPRMPLR